VCTCDIYIYIPEGPTYAHRFGNPAPNLGEFAVANHSQKQLPELAQAFASSLLRSIHCTG
jgi:hypothetical protein